MTDFTHQISFIIPADHKDAANRAAQALGVSGDSFTIPLSTDGSQPATHYGGATVQTAQFLAVLGGAPDLPPGMPVPEGLDMADWQVVADHLQVASALRGTLGAGAQFAGLVDQNGLVRVVVDSGED